MVSLEAGEKWWHQITDAIDNVDVVVLVMTPQSLRSRVVHDEWTYARRTGTRVIPVVFQDDLFADMPRWLSELDILNLTPGHPDYGNNWGRLLTLIREPYEPRPIPSIIPRILPGYFTERPGTYAEIRAELLDALGGPQEGRVALIGAPGVGKTSLALAACYDPDILDAYTDGILWVESGEEARNLTGKLTDMVNALSSRVESFNTVEAAASRLRELLAHRHCLIILDDVWNEAHVEAFLNDDQCLRLITTRDVGGAKRLGARNVYVEEMAGPEATQMLINQLPESARRAMVRQSTSRLEHSQRDWVSGRCCWSCLGRRSERR